MKKYFLYLFLPLSFVLISCARTPPINLPLLSSVITMDEFGHLAYIADKQGNIIPDFSYSGYKQSEQVIPYIATTIKLKPIKGDNTQHIQQAIDKLSMYPVGQNGFRGALLLEKGFYSVSGQLIIRASGIVIRGVGQKENDTVVFAAGQNKRSLIKINGNLKYHKQMKDKQKLASMYTPVGTNYILVPDPSVFSVNQQVIISRPATSQWIKDIGMDKIPNRIDLKPIKQWKTKRFALNYERKIIKIDGHKVFLSIPLVQAMESKYGGGFIYPIKPSGRIENIGIENMQLISEYKKWHRDSDEQHSWSAIEIFDAENVWVSDITSQHFAYSLVSVKRGSRFVTVKDSTALDPASKITGRRRYSFYLEGAQALFLRCHARNGRHDFVTGSKVAGPSAFVYSDAIQTHADIGPHHRWATGILYDNIKGGDINIQDRGNRGSGHGWAGAQNILWNTQGTGQTAVQSPPGAINWSIGHIGERWDGRLLDRPQGMWISEGKHVTPESLFVQQLIDRIGIETANKVLEKQRYSIP